MMIEKEKIDIEENNGFATLWKLVLDTNNQKR